VILASGEDLASTGISHGNSMIRIFGISWGPRNILRFLQGTIIIVMGTDYSLQYNQFEEKI
jgi:hypothetical protein